MLLLHLELFPISAPGHSNVSVVCHRGLHEWSWGTIHLLTCSVLNEHLLCVSPWAMGMQKWLRHSASYYSVVSRISVSVGSRLVNQQEQVTILGPTNWSMNKNLEIKRREGLIQPWEIKNHSTKISDLYLSEHPRTARVFPLSKRCAPVGVCEWAPGSREPRAIHTSWRVHRAVGGNQGRGRESGAS